MAGTGRDGEDNTRSWELREEEAASPSAVDWAVAAVEAVPDRPANVWEVSSTKAATYSNPSAMRGMALGPTGPEAEDRCRWAASTVRDRSAVTGRK